MRDEIGDEYALLDSDGQSEDMKKSAPQWFEWKFNIGHVITIIGFVVVMAVGHGAQANRMDALEKNAVAQTIANERQANINERLVEELHNLGKTMIRLQTQLEDRQYQQDQRQDRQDSRDSGRIDRSVKR